MAKLYFYYSAMNAGKSTTLLQASYNYLERGMQTLLFTPSFDTRHGENLIHSRIGLKQTAISFDRNFDFLSFVKDKQEEMIDLACILIDEAQFLEKAQVAQCSLIAKELKLAVLCYGLRSDFLGEPFIGSTYLLNWAEELIEIKTICSCGSKATMNVRIDEKGEPVTEGKQIQIGGNESYISQCMGCFQKKTTIMNQYAQEKKFL